MPAQAPSVQLDTLSVSPPPELPEEVKKTHFYPYRQSLTARVGFGLDNHRDFPWIFGLMYMFKKFFSPRVEIGADGLSTGNGHVYFTLRHIFYERHYFRPFFRFGLNHEVNPDERLATFSRVNNYQLRGGVGMEDVLFLPASVRLELEALYGLKDNMIIFSFGYSYPW